MKKLRNAILLLLAGALLASCGASYQQTKAQRAAEKEAERQACAQALKASDFILDVTMIIPRGFPSKATTGEYRMRVKNDVVNTRLPFMGESHEPAFGGADEISIVFKDEKVQMNRDFSDAAGGEYRYQFTGGTGKNRWKVTIQAFDNGSASIECSSTGGKLMRYTANVLTPDPNKDE